jgi:hypothetical protein
MFVALHMILLTLTAHQENTGISKCLRLPSRTQLTHAMPPPVGFLRPEAAHVLSANAGSRPHPSVGCKPAKLAPALTLGVMVGFHQSV